MTSIGRDCNTQHLWCHKKMEMLKGKTKVLQAETMTELFSFAGREVSLCANANTGKQNV